MNHLGDTNKMVETPRTDELLTAMLDVYGYVHNGNCPQRWVNHARELERELNAASKERDDSLMMLGMYRMKSDEQRQRIKRLEEANNELRAEEARLLNTNGELERRIKRLDEAGDEMFKWSERVGQEFWLKAKEDKP